MLRYKVLFFELIRSSAYYVQRCFERTKRLVKKILGWTGRAEILPYRGFGSQNQFYLIGRVLESKGIRTPHANDTWWHNARAMYRRFATNELPDVVVRARFQGEVQQVVSDEEGYFQLVFHPPALVADRPWHAVHLELDQRSGRAPVEATGYVLTPSSHSSFGVISDVDDTIIHSHATDLLKLAWITFSNNARTRVALPGVAAFYRALHRGPDGARENPFFYVSSSAWNLYDMLVDILDFHELPKGPLLLRDMRPNRSSVLQTSHGHKLEKVERILAAYPSLPFVLIGDAGQDDPLIYHQVVLDHPQRILAIYIREIGWRLDYQAVHETAEKVRALGVDMLLVKDTRAAALHAADRGLIARESLAEIRHDRQEDLDEVSGN